MLVGYAPADNGYAEIEIGNALVVSVFRTIVIGGAGYSGEIAVPRLDEQAVMMTASATRIVERTVLRKTKRLFLVFGDQFVQRRGDDDVVARPNAGDDLVERRFLRLL